MFDRPGYDMSETTEIERSLVPSGDTTFWFGAATVGRYRRGERNGLSKTADRRHRLAALQAQLETGKRSGGKEDSSTLALVNTTTMTGSNGGGGGGDSSSSQSQFNALADAAKEEDAEADEAILLARVTATDLTMLNHLVRLMQRFIQEPDVVVAALEVKSVCGVLIIEVV